VSFREKPQKRVLAGKAAEKIRIYSDFNNFLKRVLTGLERENK
jgi:hypothetical protein